MPVYVSPVTSWNNEIKKPLIDPTAFVHDSSVLIGDVRVGMNAIIYPGVILRADEGSPIIIGDNCNIQDGVIMHCLTGSSVTLEEKCSIAHGAVIHGPCVLGCESFVGFKAVIFNSILGKECFVSHGALAMNVAIPDYTYVPSGKVIQCQEEVAYLPRIGRDQRAFITNVLLVNEELRSGYNKKKVEFGSGIKHE